MDFIFLDQHVLLSLNNAHPQHNGTVQNVPQETYVLKELIFQVETVCPTNLVKTVLSGTLNT